MPLIQISLAAALRLALRACIPLLNQRLCLAAMRARGEKALTHLRCLLFYRRELRLQRMHPFICHSDLFESRDAIGEVPGPHAVRDGQPALLFTFGRLRQRCTNPIHFAQSGLKRESSLLLLEFTDAQQTPQRG